VPVDGPHGLDFLPDGTFLMDYQGAIERVSPTGDVSLVGSLPSGYFISGLAAAPSGDLYVTGRCDHRVYRVSPAGDTTVFAGTGVAGHAGDGGPAVDAAIIAPNRVAIGAAGEVYVTESGFLNATRITCQRIAVAADAERVRVVDAGGTIRTAAGTGALGSEGENGPALEAALAIPFTLGFVRDSSLLIAEAGFQRLLRVDAAGILTRFGGRLQGPLGSYSGDGGPVVLARFTNVEALRTDADGDVIVADVGNHRIRLIDRLGSVITIAGTGELDADSPDDVPGTFAPVSCPADLAVHPDGRLYVADLTAQRIRILVRQPF
jgi:DNA-binding beta-propeller fold protein YncE